MIEFIVPLITFISIVSLVVGIYYLWDLIGETGASKVERRLRIISAGGGHGGDLIKRKQLSPNPTLDRILHDIPRVHAIDRLLTEADLDLSVMKLFGLQFVTSILFCAILYFSADLYPVLALIIGITAGCMTPYIFVSRRASIRRKRFIEMLPDTLDFMARSLRAGNPYLATLKMVADEVPDPIGTEFGIVFDEINYGLETKDALLNFTDRIHCEEVQYFAAAVIIQKVTGGNLADVLNKIAEVMRARDNAYREIAIQAAEMKLSANVLIGLPFFVAGGIAITQPTYFNPLFDHPLGQVIIALQLFLMVIGYFVIKRMISFRV